MTSEVEDEGVEFREVAPKERRVLEADLFAEGTWSPTAKRLDFMRGVTTYPLPMQSVYLMTREELRELYAAAEVVPATAIDPMIELGTYVGAEGSVARASIDRMFAQHCAVLGSTGSGKSGAVAAIIHSILGRKIGAEAPLRPRIILIDPHGEYSRAFSNRAIVYRAFDTVPGETQTESSELKLPYWLMSGEEFRSLVIGKTEDEATSQNNIVYKALSHSRMVQAGLIEPAKDWTQEAEQNATAEPDEPRPLPNVTRNDIESFNRDLPRPFSLQEFRNHIRWEQGVTWNATTRSWKAKSPTDFKSHRSILDKLSVLDSDVRLRFLMSEYVEGRDPSLEEVIAQFVGRVGENPDVDIRIIDTSGLPNEVAGPLTAAISRLLFQYKVWQTRAERERDPVALIFEEAHRYVPNQGQAEYEAAQGAIRRIAKEGRKYGLGLMLVSQRPSDVEPTVLSQCNTWLILRLTNATDQNLVSRFLPDSLTGLTRLLPSLGRREAIFVGEAASLPARIRIRELLESEQPRSNDVSFAAGWAQAPLELQEIEPVVGRWTRRPDPQAAQEAAAGADPEL